MKELNWLPTGNRKLANFEVNRFLVGFEQLFELAQKATGWPSGEAVKDQHCGTFTEVVAQFERLFGIENLQIKVGCLITNLETRFLRTNAPKAVLLERRATVFFEGRPVLEGWPVLLEAETRRAVFR